MGNPPETLIYPNSSTLSTPLPQKRERILLRWRLNALILYLVQHLSVLLISCAQFPPWCCSFLHLACDNSADFKYILWVTYTSHHKFNRFKTLRISTKS